MSQSGLYGAKCHRCAHLLGSTHDVPATWPVPDDDCANCGFCQQDSIWAMLIRYADMVLPGGVRNEDVRKASDALLAGQRHPVIDKLKAELLYEPADTVKVRILLDVDGVLNADEDIKQVWPDWKTAICHGFRIHYSETVGRRLEALFSRPEVQILWLTTWEHRANQWIAPLFGWPSFPVLTGQTQETGWWKFDEAKALYERDRIRFVWIDDDLRFDSDAGEWIEGLAGKALGISPLSRRGLTDRLLGEIERFVEKVIADV